MDRIRHLEEYLKEDPGDPFNHYALALEYLKTDPGKARVLFEKLLQDHPGYLPTYYPYAHLLIEQGEPERAESMFNEGMRQADLCGDLKTHRELQSAYNDWLFERS